MSKAAKLMIQIPDSESDSSGVVADNKDSQQPHPAHALNIEIPTQNRVDDYKHKTKSNLKGQQSQKVYHMKKALKRDNQKEKNSVRTGLKTMNNFNRLRMANHLGSPKHRDQLKLFRSNHMDAIGTKPNIEIGGGKNHYKIQNGYPKSDKKKLKGQLIDQGDRNSKKLKRRKMPYPASTRNLKSKHQKLGLFGGANKIKFQTELGYKNLKKSTALNLLRSNTDFRNFGKSKTGKLGFNPAKRTDKLMDFRSPKAKKLNRIDTGKRKPNTTKNLNYSQGSPFFKSTKAQKAKHHLSKFQTNPSPSNKNKGISMDNKAFLKNKQAFIKKNRAYKAESLRNQIIRYEVGRGSHKRADLTFNDFKKAARKKRTNPQKWANAEYGQDNFAKKNLYKTDNLENFDDGKTVKRANSQGNRALDQNFRKRKEALIKNNKRPRKKTGNQFEQSRISGKQERKRSSNNKQIRNSRPKLGNKAKMKKKLFIQTSFEGEKDSTVNTKDNPQVEIQQNGNISFANNSGDNDLGNSEFIGKSNFDLYARERRKSKKNSGVRVSRGDSRSKNGLNGSRGSLGGKRLGSSQHEIRSGSLNHSSNEKFGMSFENKNGYNDIGKLNGSGIKRRSKKVNPKLSSGLEDSRVSLTEKTNRQSNSRVEVKEINYPEHIHMKAHNQPKVTKKDLVYLKETNLHPSTAPNKTGKHRQLFKSKKAQEALNKVSKMKDDYQPKRENRTSQNVFAEGFEVLETKNISKVKIDRQINKNKIYRDSDKHKKRAKRRTQNRKKTRQSNNERSKPKTSKSKKRGLVIETDLQHVEARHVNTTKHSSRSGLDPIMQPLGLNVYRSKTKTDENFDKPMTQSNISSHETSKPSRKNQFPQKSIANGSPGANNSSANGQPSIFDFSLPIKEIKLIFEKMQWLCKYVTQFSDLVERGEDPYDIVRKYVDFIQDRKFNDLVLFVKNERYRKVFNKALLLERWVIFSTFYIFLDRRMSDKHKLIQKFAACVFQNNLLCILLLKLEVKSFARNDLKYLFVQVIESQVKRNKRWLSQKLDRKNVLFSIGKNCTLIETLLEEVGKNTSLKIRNGITGLKQMNSMLLDESLEFLLDTFCDYFLNKGIVSVEYTDSVRGGDPMPPFLKDPIKDRKYTLVVDETLVHYQPDGGKVLIRPHTPRFLEECAKYYEIVIFTAAQQEYADWILDRLDTKKCIAHRLYRQHTDLRKGTNIKDLSKIGRPLHRTIIVDNIAENFQLQTDNGIFIKSWYDDKNDTALIELFPLLKEIVVKNFPDVRKALNIMREQMQTNIRKGRQPHSNIGLG